MTKHDVLAGGGRWRLLVALTGTLLAVMATTTASASVSTNLSQDFAAQARAINLTGAQTAALNAEVERIQAKMGGTRVNLNTIALGGKNSVHVAVPGEAEPRDLRSVLGADAASYDPCTGGADYGWFCAYDEPNFRGGYIEMYTCDDYPMPWGVTGSWDNNQTRGTKARMYDGNWNLGYTTPGAHSSDDSASWAWVSWITNC
ncbi:hypothetical protein OHT57_45345 [Streptomyces sp. NBC_00285]|uniref:hypothetical protein n=1 Tax=Streptomyces sp. NBC_00285 TaxID=2975700 RepID=UPI002E296ACE|nr:hypothetical protein [Streptomyces sp. NBC_00285]